MIEIKGMSIGSAYNKQKELGIAVNKTFMVPVEHLYIEEGFNVRGETDQEQVDAMAESYAAGRLMPALVVKTTAKGFKVIDGHHRFPAAVKANVARVECKEFTGSEVEQVAYMVSSSQGRNLPPIERAMAYQRMMNFGMTKAEIMASVSRSRSDIDNHLVLLQAGDAVIGAVRSGDVSSSAVIKSVRKDGHDASEKIMAAVDKSKATGKKTSVTHFKPAHSRKAMEIISGIDRESLPPELNELIDLYLKDM